MSYRDLPKVELHLHHEAAVPPEFVRRLAQEKGIDISAVFDENGSYAYDGFDEFLGVYDAATAPMQTPEDFRRLTFAAMEEAASHGVIYAETFVSPDFCGGGDLVAWKEYLAAIEEGAREAEAACGIVLRTILTSVLL